MAAAIYQSLDSISNQFLSAKDKNANTGEFFLGPRFRKTMTTEVQDAYKSDLHQNQELLPFDLENLKWGEWTSTKPVQWPHSSSLWVSWFNRLKPHFGEAWKLAGIYDALNISCYDFPCDKSLIGAALCFWSTHTNTFNFRFGMMTPTLLDLAVLTGIRPDGPIISAIPLNLPGTISLDTSLIKNKTSYGAHLILHKGKENTAPGMQENLNFLLMWLCKFIFYVASNKITKEFVHIAETLALGRPVALGPIVLGHLYRSITMIVQDDMSPKHPGPIWILQLWLQAYFTELVPTPQLHPHKSFGLSIIKAGIFEHSTRDCFDFFFSTKERDPTCFSRIFDHPSRPTIVPNPQANLRESSSLWASILICRDLPFGGSIVNSKYYNRGVEVYCPNLVARQFGLCQAIPVLLAESLNGCSSSQNAISSNDLQESFKKYEMKKSSFVLRNFSSRPSSTDDFEHW